MTSRNREKIYHHFDSWLTDENKLQPGELYRLRHPTDASRFVGVQDLTNKYLAIQPGTVGNLRASSWLRNSSPNPYVAKLLEMGDWYTRQKETQDQDYWTGLFMHETYRFMATSSVFEEMTRNVKRRLAKGDTLSGVFGSISLWMKYDKYLFVPVAFMVYSKASGRQSFRFIDKDDTYSAVGPTLDRPAYVPKEKK